MSVCPRAGADLAQVVLALRSHVCMELSSGKLNLQLSCSLQSPAGLVELENSVYNLREVRNVQDHSCCISGVFKEMRQG